MNTNNHIVIETDSQKKREGLTFSSHYNLNFEFLIVRMKALVR